MSFDAVQVDAHVVGVQLGGAPSTSPATELQVLPANAQRLGTLLLPPKVEKPSRKSGGDREIDLEVFALNGEELAILRTCGAGSSLASGALKVVIVELGAAMLPASLSSKRIFKCSSSRMIGSMSSDASAMESCSPHAAPPTERPRRAERLLRSRLLRASNAPIAPPPLASFAAQAREIAPSGPDH